MKFISRWFRNKVRNALNDRAEPIRTSESHHLSSPGVRFTLYKANGGYVVECDPQYCSNKVMPSSETDNRLHIITPDQSLGEALSQIFTYEMIKR